MDVATIAAAVAHSGLICRGGFHPDPEDGAPAAAATVVMVGNAGEAMWQRFARDVPMLARHGGDPLDTWIRRTIGAIAAELGAQPLFPFDGPPYWPFQRWAQRAERVFPSPLGILIHPDYGLWHAYRGAMCFAERIALPAMAERASPCEGCASKPCLTSCPAGAFSEDGYALDACVHHLGQRAGADCMALACRARRACPEGTTYQYHPDQAAFHMRAFRDGRGRSG